MIFSPSIKASAIDPRRKEIAPLGAGRVLDNHAVELIGFFGVSARKAGEGRGERLVLGVAPGGENDRLMHRSGAIPGPHPHLAGACRFDPDDFSFRNRTPCTDDRLRASADDEWSRGPIEQQCVLAHKLTDGQRCKFLVGHQRILTAGSLRGGSAVELELSRDIGHDNVVAKHAQLSERPIHAL